MALFVKNLLFTVVVPGTAAVYLPMLIAGDYTAPPVWSVALALPVLVLGAVIYIWCLWEFAVFGEGTPAPIDAPKKLVVRGLYRYSRNPMYLGVLAVILGWVILLRDGTLLLYAMTLATVFHLFVVFYEERRLRKVFGEEYERYCAEVRRWAPKWKWPAHRPSGWLG